MHPTLSIYLDLVRLISALLVLFFHANYPRFHGEWLNAFQAYGHDAVIVFFVLSGFVVAYSAKYKDKNLESYTISRLRVTDIEINAIATKIKRQCFQYRLITCLTKCNLPLPILPIN